MAARLVRNHLLSGFALPEHWLGGGGDVNRATAAEMGAPAHRTLEMYQRGWGEILRRAAEIVVSRRLDPSGASWIDPADPTYAVTVDWPPLVVEDSAAHAQALAQTVSAAALAVDRGLLSEPTATRLVVAAAERLGIEIDPDEEEAAARADADRRAAADAPWPDPPEEDEEG